MRRTFIYFLFFTMAAMTTNAQFVAGSGGFYIKSATPVALNGLTLKPSVDVTIANNSLSVSAVPIPGSPTSSIKRVYTFSSPLTFSGIVGIFYVPASELNGNTESQLSISYSSTASGTFLVTAGSTPAPASDYVSNTLSAVALSSVTAANAATALPVSLVDFRVKKEENTALLTWTTSFEANASSFDIQRSNNGKNWEILGDVKAAGESRENRSYSFSDKSPLVNGNNFYRLKMIDLDGTYAFSTIRTLAFDGLAQTTLFPNPTAEKLTIKVDDWSKVSGVQITNLQGIVVYDHKSSPFANGVAEINMKTLPAGAYLVRILRTDGVVQVLKVVRQ